MRRATLISLGLCAFSVIVSAQAVAQETRWHLFGDASIGINLHSAQFQRVNPQVPSCCANFTSGNGFGLTLGAALGYDLTATLHDAPLRVGARLSWSDLSGTLSNDEFFTNVISGSSVSQGIARHTVAASYSILGVEPTISANVIPDLPLRIRVGALLGLPMWSYYTQREQLVAPTDASITYSNGQRERNVYEGDLPSPATQVYGTVALSYPIGNTSNLEINSELSYALALTNLTASLQWNVAPIRLGVVVRYNVPPPDSEPPAPPPPPPVEPVPVRVPMVLSRLEMPTPADTLVLPMIRQRITRTSFEAPAVMFFEKNTTIPLQGLSERDAMQQRTLEAVREVLARDPKARLTIIGSSAADEPTSLARERFAWAVRSLGVDITRIAMKTENPVQPEDSILMDEQRCVTFLVNDRAPILKATDSIVETQKIASKVAFAHVLTCDTICESTVGAMINGKPLAVQGTGPALYVVIEPTELLEPSAELVVRSRASVDTVVSTDVASRTLVAGSEETTIIQRALTTHSAGQIYTLSYFEFNSSTPRATSPQDLAEVQSALQRGQSVTLIASTDNIGTEESNRMLAQRRAQSVIKLLGVSPDRVSIEVVVTDNASNASPMGRVANRSVRAVVRSQNK